MDLAVPKKDWVEACREIVEAAPYLFIEGVLRPQTGRGKAHSAAVKLGTPYRSGPNDCAPQDTFAGRNS